MRIQYLYRKKGAGYSIEGLFSRLAEAIRTRFKLEVAEAFAPHLEIRPRNLWANLRAARQLSADVYHITGDVHYLALALPGRRTVLTIHDCVSLDRMKAIDNRLAYYTLWLLFYYLPMRRVAYIVTVSEKSRQELIRFMGPLAQRVRVIPNHYNPRFRPCPKPFNEVKPVLLHIENGAHKNLHRLAEAIAGFSCSVVIIGLLTAEQHAMLQRFNIEYINKHGLSDDDVLAEYERCDMLVFVSLYEGFGLPILEANAVGRVVLTSDISPLREVAGEGALLIDPESVVSIRAGVSKLTTDRAHREQLINAGYRNAALFTVERVAEQYMTIYQSIPN